MVWPAVSKRDIVTRCIEEILCGVSSCKEEIYCCKL